MQKLNECFKPDQREGGRTSQKFRREKIRRPARSHQDQETALRSQEREGEVRLCRFLRAAVHPTGTKLKLADTKKEKVFIRKFKKLRVSKDSMYP